MTDLQLLKDSFKAINLNYTCVNTLIGTTVTIYAESKEIDFEFDCEGNFLRII